MASTSQKGFFRASASARQCAPLIAILVLVCLEFGYFSLAYPAVGSIDEVAEVIDGIAIRSYAVDAASGNLTNPVTYFEDVQSHTFGLALKSRPPYFRAAESALFTALPAGIESARLLVLFHALLFFAAWYYFVSKDYGQGIAVLSSLLLLASLSFMQYSWRVYLEFAYLFFALLAMKAFSAYLDNRSNFNLAALFILLFLGMMTKEVFVAIFPAFAIFMAFRLGRDRSIASVRGSIGCLFENRLFLPALAALAILAVPWYAVKASTPLAAQLAAGSPLSPQSLFLAYPSLLLQTEPLLTAGFALFCAAALLGLAKPRLSFASQDALYLSFFLGFYLIVSIASHKELRYLFFAYPILALFTARLIFAAAPSRRACHALAASAVLAQAALSAAFVAPQLPQLPIGRWQPVASHVESEGGNYLLVANPSNTALSYYLLLDGDWRGNHLTRLHPSALDPAKKACGASVSDPQGLLHCVLGYYRIDAVIVDRAPDATTPDQLALASEISRNGSFALSKSFGAIDIYSVQKKG